MGHPVVLPAHSFGIIFLAALLMMPISLVGSSIYQSLTYHIKITSFSVQFTLYFGLHLLCPVYETHNLSPFLPDQDKGMMNGGPRKCIGQAVWVVVDFDYITSWR